MRRGHVFSVIVFLFTAALLAAGAALAAQTVPVNPLDTLIADARADLELLADAALAGEPRPVGWTFQFGEPVGPVNDLWFDNEQLADRIFGAGERPNEWIVATSRSVAVILRSVRHDLELSADVQFGENTRPPEWRGGDPLQRCSRTLQNIVVMLGTFYAIETTTPASAFDYCSTVAAEAEDSLVARALGEQINTTAPELILAVRGDLERLADERLGLNTRPPGWIGNRDINSPTLIGDNFLDLESLANVLLGNQERPESWIGVVTNSPAVSYRNLRHDLELMADISMGENNRPRGWQGLDPLTRCQPTVQNLVFLAQQNYGFTVTSDPTAASELFCADVESSANFAIENPPISEVTEEPSIDERLTAESQYAFSYLDVAATQYMGIMPAGTRFRAWYRNFGDSRMMFVSGEEFALYIDQRFTTLPEFTFDGLPSLEGVVPLTFCDAEWCNGPGPTPTPTGGGILVLLLPTPIPPPDIQETGNKTQVNWNSIRVTYLSDNTDARTAQVMLEICTDTTLSTCEPVVSIFDNAIGTAKPVISQFNGLNVFEFRYGYTANLLIEGSTLTSPDVWISDPTIR